MIVWQEKLKIPNPVLIKETYELITDGKGDSLKMPSIAEFLKVYKERERLLVQKLAEKKEIAYSQKRDFTKSKEMFSTLVNAIDEKQEFSTNLCGNSVKGIENGREFTLTRDNLGRDYVTYRS
mgnify:CR=1 FL=1